MKGFLLLIGLIVACVSPPPNCGKGEFEYEGKCLKSCKGSNGCPDYYITIYDPQVCALKTDGSWQSYNSWCQACKSGQVRGVDESGPCSGTGSTRRLQTNE